MRRSMRIGRRGELKRKCALEEGVILLHILFRL
jgi:hypothetical protein